MNGADQLIRLLWDAARDRESWQVFLDEVRRVCNADHAVFSLGDPAFDSFAVHCVSGATFDDFRPLFEEWGGNDPWVTRGIAQHPPGVVVASHSVISDEELESLPIYREYYGPLGWHYGMGCSILLTEAKRSGISFCRAKSKGPYQESEMDVLRGVYPHLQRAACLYTELVASRQQNRFMGAYADMLPYGFAILTADRQVLFANSRFDRIARACPAITRAESRIEIRGMQRGVSLQELVAKGESQQFTIRSQQDRRIGVVVTTLPPAGAVPFGPAAASFTLLLLDPGVQPAADIAFAAELFDLTPAEARIALLLARGQTTEEAADQLCISIHTARTHVKRVLAKTNCRRQAELIRLLSGIAFTRVDAESIT